MFQTQQPQAIAEPSKLILILLAGVVAYFIYFMFLGKSNSNWSGRNAAAPVTIGIGILWLFASKGILHPLHLNNEVIVNSEYAGPFAHTSWGQLLFAPAGLAFIFFLTSSVTRFFDTPREQRSTQRQHESDAGLGLFLIYRSIAIIVGCLTAIIFVSGGLGVMDRPDANLAGTLCAIFAGLLWAGSNYARILLKAGPDESNRESVRQYHSATTSATILRSIGLVLVFLCGMLFVVHGHEGDDEIKFAAIACAILSAPAYTIAGMLDKAWVAKPENTRRA